MSKKVVYFSHDSDASGDEKIIEMLDTYGWEGYGIYWKLLELMTKASAHELKYSSIKAISKHMNIKETFLSKYLEDCFKKFKLFEKKNGVYYSSSLKTRMEKVKKKSINNQHAANERWGK